MSSTSSTSNEIILVTSAIFVLVSVVATYYLSKFVDMYYVVDIDEAVIRRIEEMRMRGIVGDQNGTNIVLDGMEPGERLKVLERVLDCKPYSRELGKQLQMETEWAAKDEKIIKGATGGAEDDHNDVENGDTDELNDSSVQEEGKEQDMNILDQVWKEFGDSKNAKKREPTIASSTMIDNLDENEQHHELTETCAICMENYEEDQDVIIGNDCVHIYHKKFLLKWMSYKHDTSPYCRLHVFDVQLFQKAAEELLGKERYAALVHQDEDGDPELRSQW